MKKLTRLVMPTALAVTAFPLAIGCGDDDLIACADVEDTGTCVRCLDDNGNETCAGDSANGCEYSESDDECHSGQAA